MMVKPPLAITRVLLLGALSLGLGPVSAIIAAEARVGTEIPTEKVIAENQVEGSSGVQLRNQGDGEGANRWVGFSFTAPAAGQLDKINLFLSSVGAAAPEGIVHIALVSLTDLKELPARPFAELSGEDATLPTEIAAPGTVLTLDLEKPWDLEAGASYGIVLSFTEPVHGRRINFATSSGKGAPGQTFHTEDGGSNYKTVNPVKYVLQAP